MLSVTLSLLALSSATAVYAQAAGYAQCGGMTWQGATTCVAGYTCTVSSEYYSQCLPGSESASITTTGTGSTTPTSSSGSSPTNGPGTTLQAGYYWIRAVEDPNFHKYLQTDPEYEPGTALLADYTTAGQFQIVDGQLVELVTGGLLYAVVEPQANSTVVKLSVSFGSEMNTYGTFAFSGDAVQWSIPSISRPNLSAWLVCGSQTLWINLGAYAYMTPAGCADETIHYYNGATAVS
ncbi:putative mannan endo-1,4-beta-mannosidase F [Lachnellula subtilissima]|uniref:Putative mannan endo-1,4-beta-mannosidase F n=1 Tax=Lachnellula subtilissima TaxID=602034 RepID=A0A8H8UAC9_9HELO|nr:putative mannan endo-1,4-beta-mannosidase F [Lachnellula subtilissima]